MRCVSCKVKSLGSTPRPSFAAHKAEPGGSQRCYILSTRRTDVWADDREGKFGKIPLWACFLSLLSQKRGQEDLLKLPAGSSNVIFLP